MLAEVAEITKTSSHLQRMLMELCELYSNHNYSTNVIVDPKFLYTEEFKKVSSLFNTMHTYVSWNMYSPFAYIEVRNLHHLLVLLYGLLGMEFYFHNRWEKLDTCT